MLKRGKNFATFLAAVQRRYLVRLFFVACNVMMCLGAVSCLRFFCVVFVKILLLGQYSVWDRKRQLWIPGMSLRSRPSLSRKPEKHIKSKRIHGNSQQNRGHEDFAISSGSPFSQYQWLKKRLSRFVLRWARSIRLCFLTVQVTMQSYPSSSGREPIKSRDTQSPCLSGMQQDP